MKELSQETLKHTSVIFILIGAIMFLLGVAGGIITSSFSLPISDVAGRLATGLVGLALVGLGMYLALQDERQHSSEPKDVKSKDKEQAASDQMTWDEVWKKLNQLAIEVHQEPFKLELVIGVAEHVHLLLGFLPKTFDTQSAR